MQSLKEYSCAKYKNLVSYHTKSPSFFESIPLLYGSTLESDISLKGLLERSDGQGCICNSKGSSRRIPHLIGIAIGFAKYASNSPPLHDSRLALYSIKYTNCDVCISCPHCQANHTKFGFHITNDNRFVAEHRNQSSLTDLDVVCTFPACGEMFDSEDLCCGFCGNEEWRGDDWELTALCNEVAGCS